MFDNLKNCFICLKEQSDISLLYTKITSKDIATQYLPMLVEEISGVKIRLKVGKEIIICNECTKAILQAETIIKKCRESHTKWLEVEDLMVAVPPEASKNALPTSAIDDTDDADDYSSEEEEDEEEAEAEEQIAKPQTTIEEVSILPDVLVKSEYCITEDMPMEEDSVPEESQDNDDHEESHNSQEYVVYDVAEREETDPIVIRYRRMMETRHLKKAYIFNCENCTYTTTIAEDFMQHTKDEHNIVNKKIFKCNICGHNFTLFYYLQGHVRTVHERKNEMAKRAEFKPPVPMKKSSVRCKVCSKILSKTSIHRHMRTIHANTRNKKK